jgi:hypothetical protein
MRPTGVIVNYYLRQDTRSQSLGNAGTIQGSIVDPQGAVVPRAQVTLRNPLSGYSQTLASADDGAFHITNIPPNSYQLHAEANGFAPYDQYIVVRNAVPVQVNLPLKVSVNTTTIAVDVAAADLLQTESSAHVNVDRNLLLKIPAMDTGGNLSQAIVYSTGGVAADGNGFFHPLGDCASVSFIVDGQPITDRQNKIFSTQLPVSAIQSMQLTTGRPDAEFGDKSSLIAEVVTRSGLGAPGVFGSIDSSYGSFGTAGGGFSLGFGSATIGNFTTVDGGRSGRFLDTPEFRPIHDKGNNGSIFDRLDYQPGKNDVFHLNLLAARNWMQIPNPHDQLLQDQRQRSMTWNIAPGYQHIFNSHSLLTVNPYLRKDQLNYYPSRDPLDDTPATQSQNRQLLNWGVKADVASTVGHHTIKYGFDLKQTRLLENFAFGITFATFNSPCLDADNDPVADTTIANLTQCAVAGYQPNTSENPNAAIPFLPGLVPYDLTRGGTQFAFHATGNVNQLAAYAQDEIVEGNFEFTIGFRLDRYAGLVTKIGPQPRAGVAYHVRKTRTVLRLAYSRTFETPFNENLLLSNATGVGGLAQNVFGSNPVPISPGFRNQFNCGFQQAIGKLLLVDVDTFWKYTHNAYDFSTLLNSTIIFPIAWHNSKLHGVTGRVSTTNLRGFQAYWTFGHTVARYFPPETGGLLPQGAPLAGGVFKIDHDQVLQSTLVLRYQLPDHAEWITLTDRYDSGLVVSGVPDAAFAMSSLTPNQQVSIGLACGPLVATAADPTRSCNTNVNSKLLALPQAGRESDDHSPDRVTPRNVFDLEVGTDNLLHREHRRINASLEVDNLTGKVALYNFLSTFTGTHFLEPRTVTAHLGYTF